MALAKLAVEDPSFSVKTDPETGQTIISGMGELHLEIIVDRLVREFKIEAYVGRPQVAYRETIAREADGRGEVHPPDRRARRLRPRVAARGAGAGQGDHLRGRNRRRRLSRPSSCRRSSAACARRWRAA